MALTAVCLLLAAADASSAISPPTGLRAEGHDSHIDLVWERVSDTDDDLFYVYRAEQTEGPWRKLTQEPNSIHVYSDFIGENDKTYHYRVTRWVVDAAGEPIRRRRRRFEPDAPDE